jgi:uncharacterized membrane protein YbhN (UPF0104 family)
MAGDSFELAAMPKSEKSRLGLVVRIIVSLGLLTWLGSRVDWQHIAASFRGLRWGWWLTAVGIYLACQFLCCVRWLWLSRPLGFHQSLSRFSAIYFVGMFFNLFLPTSVGGDAIRAIYLANGSGRRLAALFSVLLDRASGLVVLIGVACLALLLSPVALPLQLRWMTFALGIGTCLGMLALPFIVRINLKQPKIHAFLSLLRDYPLKPGLIVGSAGLSIIVQVLNAVLVGCIGIGLGLKVPAIYYGVAAPMVTLFTLIPISLNGMGLREGAMVVFLAPAGIASADAITLAFLWFLVQTTTSVFGAVPYLFGRFGPVEGKTLERSTLDHRSPEGRTSECRAAA